MFAYILWAGLAAFFFSFTAKGFSAQGIPITKTRNMTGVGAKILAVLCAVLGLACTAAFGLIFLRRNG